VRLLVFNNAIIKAGLKVDNFGIVLLTIMYLYILYFVWEDQSDSVDIFLVFTCCGWLN